MKYLVVFVLFFLGISDSFSQDLAGETGFFRDPELAHPFNLPPGSILYPKTNTNIDYSYKLSLIPSVEPKSVPADRFLWEYSDADLNEMKELDMASYTYYMTADSFYNSLSGRVKSVFNVKELWYIYMFDQDLKDKLLTIK